MADNGAECTLPKKLVDLRVVDLKLELEKRFLEKTGVKQALVERLKKALLDEGHDPDQHVFQVSSPQAAKTPRKVEPATEAEPVSEDIGSDAGDLISISYEDEKDASIEIFHIADEDVPELDDLNLHSTPVENFPSADKVAEELCHSEKDELILSSQDEDSFEQVGRDENEGKVQKDPLKLPENDPSCDESDHQLYCSTIESQTSQSSHELRFEEEFSFEADYHIDEKVTDVNKSLESKESHPVNSCEPMKVDDECANKDDIKEDECTEIIQEEVQEPQDNKEPPKESSAGDSLPVTDEASDKNLINQSSPEAPSKQQPEAPTTSTSATCLNPTDVQKEKSSTQEAKPQNKVSPSTAGNYLWVSGLSSSTRAADLKNLFSKYGKVTGAKVVTNAKSPGSKCYGFVTMASTEEASKCIQHLHRTELHGRMISVERAKGDPSAHSTIDKKQVQPASTKPKETDQQQPKVTTAKDQESKTNQRSCSQDKKTEKKDPPKKLHANEKKLENESSRSRRHSRGGPRDASKDILTLDKIREERERERQRQWERIKRKEERRQQMIFQRERERQREVERMQRDEADRLAREREKLRLEKQRLELDRLQAERERVALEREKQRREREKLEREREERRREMQRQERGTKRPADSSSYWPESKRLAHSPETSSRSYGTLYKSEPSRLETAHYADKKDKLKHGDKTSSRRDVEAVVDHHSKSSRKPSSPKIAWRPCSKSSVSPTRHHSSRDEHAYVSDGVSQAWHSSSTTSRPRIYESAADYGHQQHWSNSRHLAGSSSRNWTSTGMAGGDMSTSGLNAGGSFLSSAANILLSSGSRGHSESIRHEGYKNLGSSSSRRY